MAASALDSGLSFTADSVDVLDHTSYTDDRGTSKDYRQQRAISFSQLRTQLLTDSEGQQEVRLDSIVDLTAAGAKFVNFATIPAGSKITCAIIQITELVVAGSTTVKVGLGTNGTSPSLLGKTADLLKNSQNALIPADAASIIATSTNIDVCGVTTAGTALGDTNVSAGKVRVILTYIKPATIANV